MRGSVVRRADRWYVKVELGPRSGDRPASPEVALGLPHQAGRRAGSASICSRSSIVVSTSSRPSRPWACSSKSGSGRSSRPFGRPPFDSYARNVRIHVIGRIGEVRLTKVDAGTLNGLYATLLAEGRRPPSGLGPRAIRLP